MGALTGSSRRTGYPASIVPRARSVKWPMVRGRRRALASIGDDCRSLHRTLVDFEPRRRVRLARRPGAQRQRARDRLPPCCRRRASGSQGGGLCRWCPGPGSSVARGAARTRGVHAGSRVAGRRRPGRAAAAAITLTTPFPAVAVAPGANPSFDITSRPTSRGRVDLTVGKCPTAGRRSCAAAASPSTA